MKSIIISLLLFFTVNAQDGVTRWYVNRDATGANTGRSWTNAWTSLDSSDWLGYNGVNWNVITAGDTIYVSGGTDSTTYRPPQDNLYSGVRRVGDEIISAFSQQVIIAPSWEANHNGDVYFVTADDNTYGIFHLAGVSNVKITGMNFVDRRTQATDKRNSMIEVYGTNNTIENSLIYNNNITTGVYLEGDSLTLKDNIFEYVEDDYAHDWDTDAVGTSSGGNFFIDGNSFYFRNTQETEAHRDALQLNYADGGTGIINMVVKNNLFIVKAGSWYWNSLIYSSVAYSDANWYIYNNIFVTLETGDASNYGALFFYNSEGDDIRAYVFNNTFVMDNATAGSTPINIGNTDTLIIKNNLIVTDDPINYFYNLDNFIDNGVYHREVDYNGYYESGGWSNSANFYTGEITSMSYTQWKDSANFSYSGDLYDVHSLTGNSTAVTFAEKYGEDKSDYYTTTGRDLGVDLSAEYPELLEIIPDLAYDILGNLRTGAWDMGALEYRHFRKAVLLGHSVQRRMIDYSQVHEDSTAIITSRDETLDYNTANSYTGVDTVSIRGRYFPAALATSWYNYYNTIVEKVDTGFDNDSLWFHALPDTFEVIAIKGGIQNSHIVGNVLSPFDTTNPNHLNQLYVNVYKHIFRKIVTTVSTLYPDNYFVLLTGCASGDIDDYEDWSTDAEALRMHNFATWAKDTLGAGLDSYGAMPENVYIFDSYHIFADPTVGGNQWHLKTNYVEDISGANGGDHPNGQSMNALIPVFIPEIFDAAIAYEGYAPAELTDTIPSFSFTALTGRELNTEYIASSAFDNADSTFSVWTTTSAQFKINYGGSYSTAQKTADMDDTVYVKNQSSGSYSTKTTETIVAGGVSRDFDVTTKAETGGIVNGGWLNQSNGKKIYSSDGKAIITK